MIDIKILCPDSTSRKNLVPSSEECSQQAASSYKLFPESCFAWCLPLPWAALRLVTEWGRGIKSWPFGVLFSQSSVPGWIKFFDLHRGFYFSLTPVLHLSLLFTGIVPNKTTCFQSSTSLFASRKPNLWQLFSFIFSHEAEERRPIILLCSTKKIHKYLCLLENKDVHLSIYY